MLSSPVSQELANLLVCVEPLSDLWISIDHFEDELEDNFHPFVEVLVTFYYLNEFSQPSCASGEIILVWLQHDLKQEQERS